MSAVPHTTFAIALACSCAAAFAIVAIGWSFGRPLRSGHLTRFLAVPTRGSWQDVAVSPAVECSSAPHAQWTADFARLLQAQDPGLQLDLLVLTALAFVRTHDVSLPAVRLCLFVFYADRAVGPLLGGGERARLLAFLSRGCRQDGLADDLFLPIWLQLLETHGSMSIFRIVLEIEWRQGWFDAIVQTAAQHPRCARRARAALEADPATSARDRDREEEADRLAAAELLVAGLVGADRFEPEVADTMIARLLARSSERYVSKVRLAHFLCEHLAECARPPATVALLEQHIVPRAWDDYSNFQQVFSVKTWTLLRSLLTRPDIVNELDGFVARHDRRGYWRHFENRGER